jgi:hypothetical protein
VFDALESENEIEMKRSLLSEEEKIIQRYNISDDIFEKIRENALKSRQYRVENQWKFVGALYFSLVVCSVIGKSVIHMKKKYLRASFDNTINILVYKHPGNTCKYKSTILCF